MILKRKNNFSPKFNFKKSHIKKNFQKCELHKSSENIVKGINKDLELIFFIFIWTSLCLPKKKKYCTSNFTLCFTVLNFKHKNLQEVTWSDKINSSSDYFFILSSFISNLLFKQGNKWFHRSWSIELHPK